jgi:ABC-2 type transport system ATP-binding protein
VTDVPAIEFAGVSRWYGDTVAVADVSFTVGPGVTGLLGHNGAGKSTTLKLCAGFTSPSAGTVRIFGVEPRRNPGVYERIGVVPDQSPPWPFLTAHEVVGLCARLHRVADPDAAAAGALDTVGLADVAGRKVGGFSHGMRQRVKLAQALAHQPDLLLLDEPLNGLDPAQRREIIEVLHRLGDEGCTVIVSSHVLHEVERMAPQVLVLVNGHLVAEGQTSAIRQLISERPRTIRVAAGGDGRPLAGALVDSGAVDAVRFEDGAVEFETADVDGFSRALPALARRTDTLIRRVEPVGDDLESVYAYLHDRARGAGR